MKLSDLQAMQAKIAKASEMAKLISGAEAILKQVESGTYKLQLFKVADTFKTHVATDLQLAEDTFDGPLKAMLTKVKADATIELDSL